MTNSDFESGEDGNFPSLEVALMNGIVAAARVACDDIADGKTSVAVDVRVEQDGKVLGRRVLSLSVADLIPGE